MRSRHPFVEGNGRVQRVFLDLVAERAGYTIELRAEDRDAWNEAARIGFLAASIEPMARLIESRLERIQERTVEGTIDRDGSEELSQRQAIEAQLERNLRVRHPDNETLVEKAMERARAALDDLQRQGKALPEITVVDRTIEKRIETQIDKAQSGPTIDEMRDNIRQQERDRDKDIER